jgi:hypothetical protein
VFSSHSSRDSLQAVAVTKWLREQEPGLVDEICLDLDPHTGIRQLRRLLPAAAQLLLLGATLFRHPDRLGTAVPVRRARRHQPVDRPAGQRLGSIAKLDELQNRPTQTSAEAAAIVLDPL